MIDDLICLRIGQMLTEEVHCLRPPKLGQVNAKAMVIDTLYLGSRAVIPPV